MLCFIFHVMCILCIFLLGNEWYPTKEANSLFSLVAFHFVSRNIVLCHTNDTSLKKEAVDNELFWVLLFFCLFYNHHRKKSENGSERKIVDLCHHQPFFCVCTQRIVLPKQHFVQVFISTKVEISKTMMSKFLTSNHHDFLTHQ